MKLSLLIQILIHHEPDEAQAFRVFKQLVAQNMIQASPYLCLHQVQDFASIKAVDVVNINQHAVNESILTYKSLTNEKRRLYEHYCAVLDKIKALYFTAQFNNTKKVSSLINIVKKQSQDRFTSLRSSNKATEEALFAKEKYDPSQHDMTVAVNVVATLAICKVIFMRNGVMEHATKTDQIVRLKLERFTV